MRPAILLGSLLLFLGAGPLFADSTEPLSVDYIIGMLQTGMSQEEIATHIRDEELTFIVRKGDIDRLLDAGVGEDLLMAVLQGGWSRPRRLEPDDAEGEGVDDDYDGGPAYRGYFYFGWPGYYYDPWYYGYYGYYGHYYPRHSYYYYPSRHYGYRGYYGSRRHGHHVAPRGSPRGHHVAPRGSPRGRHVSPRGSPRGRHVSPRGRSHSSFSRGSHRSGRGARGSR